MSIATIEHATIKNNANIQYWVLALLHPEGVLKVDSCIVIAVLD